MPSWNQDCQGSGVAGGNMAGTNFNNLRHADDTTLMAESEEELKSLLMKVKEEREKAGFKVNMKKKQNKTLRNRICEVEADENCSDLPSECQKLVFECCGGEYGQLSLPDEDK